VTFRGVFVTGTDTGVGKTVVTATLVAVMRRMGIDAVPAKPIQTGCEERPEGLVAPDLEFTLTRNGLAPDEAEQALMCPYRFRSPCSPHLAADRENAHISIDQVVHASQRLAEQHQAVLVEGAGGILVPITGDKTMVDLMEALDLPIVLVTRPSLGTLNHTLLSLAELSRRNLRVGGLVFNQSEPGPRGYVEEDNRETLARMGAVPVLADLPFRASSGHGTLSPEDIQALADSVQNTDALARLLSGGEE